jgi:hypothetical protein
MKVINCELKIQVTETFSESKFNLHERESKDKDEKVSGRRN